MTSGEEKNQLKVNGGELLNQIHSYRLVQTPGPADIQADFQGMKELLNKGFFLPFT